MELAMKEVSTIQLDIVDKARTVVETARKQAYILIKAREANEAATAAAAEAQRLAFLNLERVKREGADANVKAIATLRNAEAKAKADAALAAQTEIEKQQAIATKAVTTAEF